MATFSLCTLNHFPHSHSSSASPNPNSLANLNSFDANFQRRRSGCRNAWFAVLSAHSNPRILKSNRRSRYGQVLSPYDTEDNAGDEDEDWLFDVSSMFLFLALFWLVLRSLVINSCFFL